MSFLHQARMSNHDPVIEETLSSSIVAFIGSVGHLDAIPPEERVARVAGNAAPDIVPRISAILDEVYSADPPLFLATSVLEMYGRVDAFLRGRHAELSDDAVKAIANRFTFDWK
jgi:hypothetical protein